MYPRTVSHISKKQLVRVQYIQCCAPHHSQVRSNLVLVALVCAAGALLSAYLGSFFRVVAEPQYHSQRNVCGIERSRADWPAFLSLGALDVYVGPHLFSLALAVALLVRLHAESRTRARLLRDGIFLQVLCKRKS